MGEGRTKRPWASAAVQGVAQRCFARIVTADAFAEALGGGGAPALPPAVAGLPLPLESLLPAVDALLPDLDAQARQSHVAAAGSAEVRVRPHGLRGCWESEWVKLRPCESLW